MSQSAQIEQPPIDYGFEAASFRELGVPAKYRRASLVAFQELGGSASVVEALVAWLQAAANRWLYLHGPAGVGKSSLAVAVACWLVGQGRVPYFWPVMRLMDRARQLLGEGKGQAEIFQKITELDVLVLDDLGRELGTDWALERLRLLIGERYDQERLTIITSNLSLGEVGKQIDEPLAWRIRELADVVHIPGPNLRAATVQRRRQ